MKAIITSIIIIVLIEKHYSSQLTSLLCETSTNYINRLILDAEASNENITIFSDIKSFCKRRDDGLHSEVPINLEMRRLSNSWLVSFSYESFPKIYYESELSNQQSELDDYNQANRYWYLYRITRIPFDCNICRIGIYLTFNLSFSEGIYNVKYGFQKTLFSRFIDYTRQETITREDKSNYSSVNSEIMNVNHDHDNNSSLTGKRVYFDDNFFASKNQHFLIGIKKGSNNSTNKTFTNNANFYSLMQTIIPFLRSNVKPISVFDSSDSSSSSSSFLSPNQYGLSLESLESNSFMSALRVSNDYDNLLPKKHLLDLTPFAQINTLEISNVNKTPLITVNYCYTKKKPSNKYVPSFTCYAFINDSHNQCICWSRNEYKTYFIVALICLLLAMILAIAIVWRKINHRIPEITINSMPSQVNLCDKLIKIKLITGHMKKHRLPGLLDLEFKRSDQETLYTVQITPEIIWSNPNLFTKDTNYLIVNYKLPEQPIKPKFVEVTFYRLNPKPILLYLFGVIIEKPTTIKEIFPYAHYLDNRRTIRLSNSEEWTRGLARINRTTTLPVKLQKVQGLTMIERLMFALLIIRFMGIRLLITLNEIDTHFVLAAAFEAFSITILIGIILSFYIISFKPQNNDRYDVMPISFNYRVFSFFLAAAIIFVGYDLFNFIPLLSAYVWKGNQFNHQIASNYTEIIFSKDIEWIISMSICGLFCIFIMTTMEKLIVRLNKPKKPGPLAFEIGHNSYDDDLESDNILSQI